MEGQVSEEELRALFNDFDVDQSGFLSSEELRKGLSVFDWDLDADTAEQMGMTGDRQLDQDEFVETMMNLLRNKPSPEEIEESNLQAVDALMEALDKDNSGSVDKNELREFLKNNGREQMTDEDVDEMFNELDQDDSGAITRDDIVKYLRP